MKPFETQAEIYQHLLGGGKIVYKYSGKDYFHLEAGLVYGSDGLLETWDFNPPSHWHPYDEPKEKRTIKVYGYVDITTGCTFTEKSPDYTEVSDHFYRVPKLDVEHEYEV